MARETTPTTPEVPTVDPLYQRSGFNAWAAGPGARQRTPVPGETPASPTTPEVTIEDNPDDEAENTADEINALPDRATRYTDAEILGRSYAVRRTISSSANHTIRAAETVSTKFRNLFEGPGKLHRRFAHFVAEKRYNRHKARFDAVSHLPEGNRLRKRREAKLNRATERFNTTKRALEEKNTRIESRREAVGANFERRKVEYSSELIQRKEKALARREIRRNLKAQGAGRLEGRSITKEILKDVPQERLRRLGRLARTLELSEEAFKDAEYAEKRADGRKTELEGILKQNDQLIISLQQRETTAKSDLEKLQDPTDEEGLVAKEEKLKELRSGLDVLPEDDPSREALQTDINNLEKEIESMQNEIKSLESTISNSSTRVAELTALRPNIEREIRQTETRKGQLSAEADEHRATRDLDAEARDRAAEEVMTN